MASSPSYIPYLCVATAAFITTFLMVPLVKRLAIKLDAVDYPSKRRINTKPIPRLGGTAVFLGLVVALHCANPRHLAPRLAARPGAAPAPSH